MNFLRFIIAGDVASAWSKFGGFGVMLTNLICLMELSVARNLETAHRALAPLDSERGTVYEIRGELVSLQRINGQKFGPYDRATAQAASLRKPAPAFRPQPRPNGTRNCGWKRQCGGQSPRRKWYRGGKSRSCLPRPPKRPDYPQSKQFGEIE